MQQSWQPTTIGKLFTRSDSWELKITDRDFSLRVGGKEIDGNLDELDEIKVAYGLLWASISFEGKTAYQYAHVVIMDF